MNIDMSQLELIRVVRTDTVSRQLVSNFNIKTMQKSSKSSSLNLYHSVIQTEGGADADEIMIGVINNELAQCARAALRVRTSWSRLLGLELSHHIRIFIYIIY